MNFTGSKIHREAGKRGRPSIGADRLEFRKIGLTQKDMEYLDLFEGSNVTQKIGNLIEWARFFIPAGPGNCRTRDKKTGRFVRR